MKTAEEIINELYTFGYIEEGLKKYDVIECMEKYAKQACKEQRKICKNQVRGFSKAEDKILVYTAPKPDLK